jgi:tetratricopeptide (TPR) repeat protein/predicted Ser/Thr protein kinase
MIGPYQVLARLGAGGMGEVYLGHDPRLQRRIALKCLSRDDTQTTEARARILREARAAARLNHPNIAAIHDVLEDGERTFIVMEYVEGESLAARIARGPLPAAEVRTIGRQLAAALIAAHAQGVVHRDLKPANVQVKPGGSIKVLDFGVAKLSAPIASSTVAQTATAEHEGTLDGNPGTPIYMSPEQLYGREVDARSDIYSAGVILFEAATGRRPYQETGPVALALAMSSSPAPSAASINPVVPPDLNAAIAKTLERDVDQRCQSARDLETLLDERAIARVTRNQAWRVGIAAALLALAVVAITGVWARFKPLSKAGKPAVLAILPVDNPTGDERAEYLGAGIAAAVTQNFGSVPGITVLLRSATAPYGSRRTDHAAINREIGATHILDLTFAAVSPAPKLFAKLYRPDAAAPVWEAALTGDPIAIETSLFEQIGRILEHDVRRFSGEEWAQLRTVPTRSGSALSAYSEARALSNRPAVDPDRVIALYEKATAEDPEFAIAWAALGDAWWAKYQNGVKDRAFVEKANAAVARAVELAPNQAPVHYSRGLMQFRTGAFEQAEQSLHRALQLQPEFDEALRLLAQVQASLGRIDDGEATIDQALRISNNWNNWFVLGTIWYRAGRYTKAAEAFRRTTEIMPSNAGAFQMLGTTQYVLGDVQGAVGNYEHAVRLNPSGPAYANLGMAYYESARFEDAVRSYEESLRLNPNSALNHRNLADVYLRIGRADDARREYRKSVDLSNAELRDNPRNAAAIGLVALCEARLGLAAPAKQHAAEAIAVDQSSRGAWQRSAEVHALLGDSATALSHLEAAVARGFEPRMARTEDELSALRKLPRFEEILRNAGERSTPSPSQGVR